MKNNYFIDTEFIEDGSTIELISIAIVNDNRKLYYQNKDCDFNKADNWIRRNVLANLNGFDINTLSIINNDNWLTKQEIAIKVKESFIPSDFDDVEDMIKNKDDYFVYELDDDELQNLKIIKSLKY